MKVIKGLLLFSVLVMGASSCFDPPEFPTTPQISNIKVSFYEVGDLSTQDSLVVSFDFKDGDGDLGLAPRETSDPFNPSTFFLNGKVPVSTFTGYTNEQVPRIFNTVLNLGDNQSGKLATLSKKGQPGFEFMQSYEDSACYYYKYDTLYVIDEYARVIDASYNIVDTITLGSGPGRTEIYAVLETFYINKNPNHNNITVDFYTIDGNGREVKFDWEGQTQVGCGQSFDGRFPVLSDTEKPLEGTLTYAMRSNGFKILLGGRTLVLKVQIKDRALNRSNTLVTGRFTLDDI